jgi:hypothetical protein
MKKAVLGLFAVILVVILSSCLSSGETANSTSNPAPQPAQQPSKGESQLAKFQRLVTADQEKLVVGNDNRATVESIEAVFQPTVISGIGEITAEKLNEYGRPYYFKVRAIYKGYDADAERARLQNLGEINNSTLGNALETLFASDSNVSSVRYFDAAIGAFPKEANTIATFYLIAAKFNEDENGNSVSEESGCWIRFVRDAGNPLFNSSNFVVANDMHFITVEDAHVPTQQDAMMAMMGYGSMNDSSSVFDPAVYPSVDLLDARIAMDKKRYGNDNTFPTVRVKYVSSVVFKGQSGTSITVATSDGVSTERMTFGGRATGINNGDNIRVYYTIAKDPLEIWQIQAIEKL